MYHIVGVFNSATYRPLLGMPRSILPWYVLTFWRDFLTRCSLCTNQPFLCRNFVVFFLRTQDIFIPGYMTDQRSVKMEKWLQVYITSGFVVWKVSMNKRRHGIRLHLRFKFEVQIFSPKIENCEIERGIAEIMPITLLLVCSMESFCCYISWWVMNCVIQLTSIVFLCLQCTQVSSGNLSSRRA